MQHHELVEDFRNWEWCSFNSIVSEKETKLKRIELIGNFGSKNYFATSHYALMNDSIFIEIEL